LPEAARPGPETAEISAVTDAAGPLSPLGWSIKRRLIGAAVASTLLWLAVAWAMGRIP
jgi:hypothetical protein